MEIKIFKTYVVPTSLNEVRKFAVMTENRAGKDNNAFNWRQQHEKIIFEGGEKKPKAVFQVWLTVLQYFDSHCLCLRFFFVIKRMCFLRISYHLFRILLCYLSK